MQDFGVVTPLTHCIMSHIRSKDTKPEVMLRKALWNKGYRYRKNWVKLPGKPDIVMGKYQICIFIDSVFFHGFRWNHGGKERLLRGKNSDYWISKIEKNMNRDHEINAELQNRGWLVLRFWDSDIKKNLEKCIAVIEEKISQLR